MPKRPASSPLPQYGLKLSDFPSKKSWQSARARKAGYKSYADWLKTRRSEGVTRTNLGRASETYKAKIKGKFPPPKRERIRTPLGKYLGYRYFFNIEKDGWSPFLFFIGGLDPQANVILTVKTSRGRYLNYNSRQPIGRLGGTRIPDLLGQLVQKQSPDRKKKSGKKGRAKKDEKIVEVIVDVFGESHAGPHP